MNGRDQLRRDQELLLNQPQAELLGHRREGASVHRAVLFLQQVSLVVDSQTVCPYPGLP